MSNNDDAARLLLAKSYALSVGRIRAAIQGGLKIQNSRESFPPSFPGEVVGFCGQGGRHPYFRIPLRVLETTLNRIDRASPPGRPVSAASSIQRQMEEIAAACQDLRQQTYFDAGTGCINDSLPSMVPLLPPEEVWLEDKELPLDVWRLVCFEFDLVSSSVASQLSVEDFAFSAVTQSGLAFRFLINQLGNRRVKFDIDLKDIPAQWLPPTTTTLTFDVGLARIFVEAGGLLTPLSSQDFTKWYGAVRYLHWIEAGSAELRVKDDFNKDSIDSRYRGLFAEETAVGLMAVVLNDLFGAKPINNTVELLPPMASKKGPIADFVAQARNPSTYQQTTIIAESKGSLGRLIKPARQLHAKKQVTTTEVVFKGSSQTLPLTFCSSISFLTQKDKTRCLVSDPPAESNSDAILLDPVMAWRLAYAKALRFVGMETAAIQIVRGDPAEALRPIDFDRGRDRQRSDRDRQRLRRTAVARQRFDAELLLDVGEYAVGLDPQILAILRDGINLESAHGLPTILDARRERRERFQGPSFETTLGLDYVSYLDLDEGSNR